MVTSNIQRVAGFFALTFLVSWISWGIGAFLGTDTIFWPVLSTLAGFGPLIAGGVFSWRQGELRAWTRQLARWRVDGRWWILAVVGAPVLSLVGYGIFIAVSDASLGLGGGPASVAVTYLILFAYIFLLRGGIGEEMGWRGYALPELQKKYTTLVAALIVGIAWAGWHLPLFVIQGTRQSGSFALYLASVIGLSVVLAWLYTNTKGSVLLAVIFHAQWNVFDSGALFAPQTTTGLVAPAASALVIWGFAIIVILADRETMLSRPDDLQFATSTE
jgi:membrane protease YdiL (CAAX protease family)